MSKRLNVMKLTRKKKGMFLITLQKYISVLGFRSYSNKQFMRAGKANF